MIPSLAAKYRAKMIRFPLDSFRFDSSDVPFCYQIRPDSSKVRTFPLCDEPKTDNLLSPKKIVNQVHQSDSEFRTTHTYGT